jgi:tRNA(fMet)-specific endonuclease VapC
MNYLLDTNHLSPLVTPGHSLRARVRTQFLAGDTFSVVAPVLSEFLFGIRSVPRSHQNLIEWQQMRADFKFYSVDASIAEEAVELRLTLRSQGWQIGLIDSFSAIIALRDQLILLTTDKDFTAIPNLQQENWLTP